MEKGRIYQQKYEAFLELLHRSFDRVSPISSGNRELKITAAELEQYGLLPDAVDMIRSFIRNLEVEGVVMPGSFHTTQNSVTSLEMQGRDLKSISFVVVSARYNTLLGPKAVNKKTSVIYDPKNGVTYKKNRVISFHAGKPPQKLFDAFWKDKVVWGASKEACEMAANTKQNLIEEAGYTEKGEYRLAPAYRRRELDGLLRNNINRWNHSFAENNVPAHIDEIDDTGFVLRVRCD
jgi:hypothetical protein